MGQSDDKGGKISTYWEFFLALAATFFALLFGTYYSSITWENIPFHTLVEIIGAILAFIVVTLFFLGLKLQTFKTDNSHWIISGLLSMACLDIIHAISPLGNYFVWFHSLGVFVGGCLFAGVLFPQNWVYLNKKFNLLFLTGIAVLSVYSLIPWGHVPLMVQPSGRFTLLASALNIIGGMGFLMAFAYFLYQFHKTHIKGDKVLALHCLLFSLAGLLFEYSSLWDFNWWWWHGMRLTAYSLLFYFIYDYYLRIQTAFMQEKAQTEAQYKLLYEKFEFATNEAGIGIWEWDVNSNALIWNKVMHDIYELPQSTSLNYHDWQRTLTEQNIHLVESKLKEALKNKSQFDLNFEIETPTGEKKHIKALGKQYSTENMNPTTSFIGINLDITSEKKVQEQLLTYARHDDVTGLYNRKYFLTILDKTVKEAKEHQQILSLLYIDLDDFKNINDSYGHQIGDEVLKSIAHTLERTVKLKKTIARVGGDEFVLLLHDLETPEQAGDIASALLTNLNANFVHSPLKVEIKCSFSIGIALFPDSGESPESLLISADIAMYNAKQSGKNQYQYFNKDLQASHTQKIQMENALSKAIDNQELFLLYQPYVDLQTGQAAGIEALLRWHSSLFNKTILPGEFILIAEKNGFIRQLGAWVLNQAKQDWITLKSQCPLLHHRTVPFRLSINISAKELTDTRIINNIEALLLDNRLSAEEINIELTETAFIENMSVVDKIFSVFSARNIHITLDDFGTGYSSLSYLYRYHFNNIKIDKSLITQLPYNQKLKNIVKTIVHLANALKSNVIFEGIENIEQLKLLEAYGDIAKHIKLFGQGFYFQVPMAVNELIPYLQKNIE